QKIGHERNLIEKGWRPLWVVDFPMFEYDEDTKGWKARHHPFTSPKDGHEAFIEADPEKAYAKAYDMVLNGWEIAGGSVRIHREGAARAPPALEEHQPAVKWLAAFLAVFACSAFAFQKEIQAAKLPPEARETLVLVKKGGPFPHAQDGKPFGNREKLLPMRAQ